MTRWQLVDRTAGVPREATTGRGQAHRGRRRDPVVDAAILGAAVDLLGEVGYARLTMEHVASRAGVGKASLYLRWPSKVALVAEAIRRRAGVVPEIPDTGSLPQDMRTFLEGLLRARRRGEQAIAAVSGEVASNPELAAAWRYGLAGTLLAGVRTIVARAVDRGELAASSDVELLSMLPLALLQHWRLLHDQQPDVAVVERIVQQFYSPTRLVASPTAPVAVHDNTGGG
jgi:AcrR family transcriptional regulator